MAAAKARPILALNCGSSSLKFGLYTCDENTATALYQGEAEEIGKSHGRFSIGNSGAKQPVKKMEFADHVAALSYALSNLREMGAPKADAVGHRFVHGGPGLREHQLLTPAVAKQLEAAVEYAPLHLPTSLAVLEAMKTKLPGVPQAICLDTAFHRSLPDVSKTYALPKNVRELGVERYGFHGLSLESILAQLTPIPKRLVVAHLGNGASITAIRDGVSIDTSMGLTPTGGIVMGTRCGDLDPSVAVYLLRHGHPTADQLENIFDHKSGLLGISGTSSDVRDLLNKRTTDQQADLALRIFCYSARKAIAGMAAALGGVDMLVFTGGIGENATDLREEICRDLEFMGIGKNEIKVLPAEEDKQIARNTMNLIQKE
jgi:acetate kinase